MKSRRPKIVISFHTTADAMAMDAACRGRRELGKMIPVPRQISAGCGLAWSAEPSMRQELEAIMEREAIQPEGLFELLL